MLTAAEEALLHRLETMIRTRLEAHHWPIPAHATLANNIAADVFEVWREEKGRAA